VNWMTKEKPDPDAPKTTDQPCLESPTTVPEARTTHCRQALEVHMSCQPPVRLPLNHPDEVIMSSAITCKSLFSDIDTRQLVQELL